MPASGPAGLHCNWASYCDRPRVIRGVGRRPPPAGAAAPGVPPALVPPAAAPAPFLPPPWPAARKTSGDFGASARLAATTAFMRATLAVYGTDIFSSVSVAWCWLEIGRASCRERV